MFDIRFVIYFVLSVFLYPDIRTSAFFSLGQILGSKSQTGIIQYEAVELLFCLSFLLVLSQHRSLYKDVLPQLQQSM